MGRLLIVEPIPIAGISATRGRGVQNLTTRSPKEVWADTDVGYPTVQIQIDLGSAREIDTVLLGFIRTPVDGATWSIAIGLAGHAEEIVLPFNPVRAPDVPGRTAERTHGLWHGAPRLARYVELRLFQPVGASPLSAGVLVIGKAFVAELGQEWGAGRRPIDTGSATPLPSGDFATVDGARKNAFSWTFGDLSVAEADQLGAIADNLGVTRPGLVVEDPDPTPGLVSRIHYGLFQRWRAPERRNRRQTRWELEIEQWT